MITLTIEVSDELKDTLDRLSDGRKNEDFASLVLENHLKRELKNESIKCLESVTTEQAKRYFDVIIKLAGEIKQEIAAEVQPAPAEEIQPAP